MTKGDACGCPMTKGDARGCPMTKARGGEPQRGSTGPRAGALLRLYRHTHFKQLAGVAPETELFLSHCGCGTQGRQVQSRDTIAGRVCVMRV